MSTSVDRAMKSDWIVTTQFGMGGLSPSVARNASTRCPRPVRCHRSGSSTPRSRIRPTSASAVDPARDRAERRARRARRSDRATSGTHEVAVQAETAKSKHLQVGDTLHMFFPETGDQQFTVVAVYGTKEPLGDVRDLDAGVRRQRRDARRRLHRGVGCTRCSPAAGPSRRSRAC